MQPAQQRRVCSPPLCGTHLQALLSKRAHKAVHHASVRHRMAALCLSLGGEGGRKEGRHTGGQGAGVRWGPLGWAQTCWRYERRAGKAANTVSPSPLLPAVLLSSAEKPGNQTRTTTCTHAPAAHPHLHAGSWRPTSQRPAASAAPHQRGMQGSAWRRGEEERGRAEGEVRCATMKSVHMKNSGDQAGLCGGASDTSACCDSTTTRH